MKRLLLALPLVAGAAWAGTTVYGSSQTQDAYARLVEQLDQMIPLKVATESYTRGMVNSSAVTEVRTSDAADARVLFRLRHELNHSPLNFERGGTRIAASHIVTTLEARDLEPDLQSMIADVEGPLLRIYTTMGFNGQSANVLEAAALSIDLDDLALTVAASRTKFDFDPKGRVAGDGTMGDVQMQPADASALQLSGIDYDYTLDWLQDGIYVGEQNARITSMTIDDPVSGTPVAMHDIRIIATSSARQDKLDTRTEFRVTRLDSPLPVDSFHVASSTSNLPVDSFITYIQSMTDITENNIVEPENRLMRMSELGRSLLTPGLTLGYEVGMDNAGGRVDGAFGLSFHGDGSTTGFDDMHTIGDLLGAMGASTTVRADTAALEMTPLGELLNEPSVAMWLIDQGDHVTADVSVENLVATINDQPMSLALMFGELLSMPLDASLFDLVPR